MCSTVLGFQVAGRYSVAWMSAPLGSRPQVNILLDSEGISLNRLDERTPDLASPEWIFTVPQLQAAVLGYLKGTGEIPAVPSQGANMAISQYVGFSVGSHSCVAWREAFYTCIIVDALGFEPKGEPAATFKVPATMDFVLLQTYVRVYLLGQGEAPEELGPVDAAPIDEGEGGGNALRA